MEQITMPEWLLCGTFFFGTVVMYLYHLFCLHKLEKRMVDIYIYPRESWTSIIWNDKEPFELRIALVRKLPYDSKATRIEFEYVAYNLPKDIEEDARIRSVIAYARNQLELGIVT